MGIYLKILAFTALIIGFAGFAPKKDACATGTIAQQTCDTQVWRDMTNRARIETEREIMQNQNLIFKSDSILAYTCFDSMAAHIGATAGVLFTHTNYWTPMPIQWGAPYGMDNAVNTVVIAAIRTYFTSNFDHSLLGGRGNIPPLTLGMHEAPTTASRTSTYSCGIMRNVWRTAKCLNFLHTPEFANTDGYYPFIDIQAIDGDPNVDGYQTIVETRRYPANMSCVGGTPLPGSSWDVEYRQARNETAFGSPNNHYEYGTPLNTAFTDVRQRIAPFGTPTASGTASCASAIPTGVSIILSPGTTTTYRDGVCSNPGCIYSRAGGGSCTSTMGATPSTGGGGADSGGAAP